MDWPIKRLVEIKKKCNGISPDLLSYLHVFYEDMRLSESKRLRKHIERFFMKMR